MFSNSLLDEVFLTLRLIKFGDGFNFPRFLLSILSSIFKIAALISGLLPSNSDFFLLMGSDDDSLLFMEVSAFAFFISEHLLIINAD